MSNKNKKKQVVAAVTGLIVGAGAVVAGAMALKDKDNREKITNAVSDVNNHVQKTMDKAEKKVKKILV